MTLPPRRQKQRMKEPGVIRCPGHLKWIRGFQCVVPECINAGIEAAHVRKGTDGGMGMKPGDQWAIPMCRLHHHQQHNFGEPTFERYYRLDLKKLAQEFAAKSPSLTRLAGRGLTRTL